MAALSKIAIKNSQSIGEPGQTPIDQGSRSRLRPVYMQAERDDSVHKLVPLRNL